MKIDTRSIFTSLLIAVFALTAILILKNSSTNSQIDFFIYLAYFIIFFLISFIILHINYNVKIKVIKNKLNKQLPVLPEKSALNNTDIITEIDLRIDTLIEERKKEIEHLKKLEAYRKEYIGNVSHELKTPIFNIQGYIQTLLDGGLEDLEVNRKFLERVDKSVERMITIVEDLQTITQFETGELQLDFETFDISALAKDICESMEMRAKSKNISLSVRELDNISYLVEADRFVIRQALANLIVNSIKYGKEWGETKILFRDNGDFIMVEVSDNGIGIDKKHLPRLFERFYRVDKSRSREQGGSGLGLSIVKHIIEAHGQNINVMSTVGVGSVFSFNLEKAK